MEICCRTCKWYRDRVCHNDEMMIKREVIEEMINDIFIDMKADANESHLRDVIAVFEEVVLRRVTDVEFTPPDYDFRCKFYE